MAEWVTSLADLKVVSTPVEKKQSGNWVATFEELNWTPKPEQAKVKYKTFTMYYKILTRDNKYTRQYHEIVKYPANECRTKYEDESRERSKKYCETHNEQMLFAIPIDKDNKMPKTFQRINPITSKIYSRR